MLVHGRSRAIAAGGEAGAAALGWKGKEGWRRGGSRQAVTAAGGRGSRARARPSPPGGGGGGGRGRPAPRLAIVEGRR